MALAPSPHSAALAARHFPVTMAIVASGVLALAPALAPVPGMALPAAPATPASSTVAAAPPLVTPRPAPPAPPATPQPPAPPAIIAPQERIRFEEISVRAGAHIPHHARVFAARNGGVLSLFPGGGAAVAVGDYDNDGYDDVFITESGTDQPNHLLHNNGPDRDGRITFTDVTAAAGVGGGNEARSEVTGALWFDYDNDGP